MEQAIICVDTHVHYYPCYDAEQFLNSIHRNLLATAEKISTSATICAVACLLDTESSSCFSELAEGRLGSTIELSWKVQTDHANPAVLRLSRGEDQQLTIIGGRQLVTREKLELILLGCIDPIANGQVMKELLLAYQHRYGLILPWGFGKWLGLRGETVARLLEQQDLVFSLGDNAGRPSLWNSIPQFTLAQSRGVPIVAGSDPLPLASEQNVAGNSSISLRGRLNTDKPIEDLVTKIRDRKNWLGFKQQTSGLWRTVSNQLAMQIVR